MGLDFVAMPVGLLLALGGIVVAQIGRREKPARKPRLLWCGAPLRSLTYTSRALRAAGYVSESAVTELYAGTDETDFDHLAFGKTKLPEPVAYLRDSFIAFGFFVWALVRYDIFHQFFDGGVLRRTGLAWCEPWLIRLAGRRLVIAAYGADAFVLDRVTDPAWRHALLLNYPALGRKCAFIERRVRRVARAADCVVGCLVHIENLPRWDVLPLVWYPIDTEAIRPVPPRQTGIVRIAHAPNHRGAKGSEFLISSVEKLRSEGIKVELDLIERVSNVEAIARIAAADILVDQLVFGYALTAIEGMALGKIVVTGIEHAEPHYRLFARYSYLAECPAIPATPETIESTLRDLLGRRAEWQALGQANRAYAEKRHSYRAAEYLFDAVYRKIWRGEPT